MKQAEHPLAGARWTRAGLLRTALGGGALIAGGAAMGARGGSGTSLAAPSKATDATILNLFLTLERVQEGLYRQAIGAGRLTGGLAEFARTVGAQETEHVGFLTDRLGARAGAAPALDFPQETLEVPERFQDAAIELEEAAIAAYIGQSANLTRDTLGAISTVLAVEARQVAWVRDIAGISPAPRAADPGRPGEDVLDRLRERRFIR